MNTNPYSSPTSTDEEQRKSVRVKAYGLIPVTRSGYLAIQVVLIIAFVVVLVGIRPVVAAPGHSLGFINDWFWTIIVSAIAFEGLETILMLSKFKKAEPSVPK